MGINRYFNYVPTNWNIKPFQMPTEIMGKTLDTLQERSDRNYLLSQQLPDLLKVNSLDQDRPKVFNIQNQFRDRINKLAEGANGDYSQIGKQLLGLQQDIKKQLTDGDLFAAQYNYTKYQKNLQDNLEMFKKGEIREEDFNQAMRHSLSSYKGYGQIDPVTGVFNQYQDINIPKFNENKIFEEAMKNIKPDVLDNAGIVKSSDGMWYIKNNDRLEQLTFEKAQNVIGSYLMSDPDYINYERFRNKIGLNPILPQLQRMVDARARGMSYKNLKHDEDMKWNEAADYYQKERHHRESQNDMNNMMRMLIPTPSGVGVSDVPGESIDIKKLYRDMSKGRNSSLDRMAATGSLPGGSGPYYNPAKYTWLDQNHPDVKNNPILMRSVELAQDKMNRMYEQETGKKGTSEEVAKWMDGKTPKTKANAETYLNAVQTYADNLSRSQQYTGKRYALDPSYSSSMGKNLYQSGTNYTLYPVGDNDNIDMSAPRKSKEIFSDLGVKDHEDASKKIAVGEIVSHRGKTGHVISVVDDSGKVKQYFTQQLLPSNVHNQVTPLDNLQQLMNSPKTKGTFDFYGNGVNSNYEKLIDPRTNNPYIKAEVPVYYKGSNTPKIETRIFTPEDIQMGIQSILRSGVPEMMSVPQKEKLNQIPFYFNKWK